MNNAAKPRVLLVEDDLTVQNLVSTALDLHGYVVSKVCDGQAERQGRRVTAYNVVSGFATATTTS